MNLTDIVCQEFRDAFNQHVKEIRAAGERERRVRIRVPVWALGGDILDTIVVGVVKLDYPGFWPEDPPQDVFLFERYESE